MGLLSKTELLTKPGGKIKLAILTIIVCVSCLTLFSSIPVSASAAFTTKISTVNDLDPYVHVKHNKYVLSIPESVPVAREARN